MAYRELERDSNAIIFKKDLSAEASTSTEGDLTLWAINIPTTIDCRGKCVLASYVSNVDSAGVRGITPNSSSNVIVTLFRGAPRPQGLTGTVYIVVV